MKKFSTMLLAGFLALSASATLNGDGYYRVKNYKTERYIYVLDDKGKLNFQATTAELGAIELWKGYEKAITDPATVIYVKDLNGQKQDYDLQAQGTGVYKIIDYPVSIRLYDAQLGIYSIFGRNSGMSRYIGDGTKAPSEQGWVTSLDNNEYYRWYIEPITTDDSNYFAVNPSLSDGKLNYAPFFAVFPFSFHSEGMKAYTVCDIYGDKAYLKEVNGTVPGETPVIITSSSSEVAKNRLNIGGNATSINDNMLKGVYFNNSTTLHLNRVAYDKNTMRVLGKLSDGSVGFKTEDIDFLPRNQAYLVVPNGTPEELHLSTEVPPVRVSSIKFNKTSFELNIGDSETILANVLPENASNRSLEWSSTDSKVAWVNSEGRVLGMAEGEVTITASAADGSGVKASCVVKVTKAYVKSITLNKTSLDLRVGEAETLVATVLPENAENRNVEWSSTDSKIAWVNSEGRVLANSEGEATITASSTDGSGVKATCVVKVSKPLVKSITLNKTSLDLRVGDAETLVATVLPENAENRSVEWSSTDSKIAWVNSEGRVLANSEGEATITASSTDGSGVKATCVVKVSKPLVKSITLNKTSLDLRVGDAETLVATVLPENAENRSVEWSSTDSKIAWVNSEGRVLANSEGEATITASATDGSGVKATCVVKVSKPLVKSITLNITSLDLRVGDAETLVATVLPENAGNRSVEWSSTDSKIAWVNSEGRVLGMAEGEATITASATDGSGVKATCVVKVSKPLVQTITLNKTEETIRIRQSFKLTATVSPEAAEKNISWSSELPSVATVDSEGNVSGVSVGTTVITASVNDGANVSATCTVTVLPALAESITLDNSEIILKEGESLSLVASILPVDADNEVEWSSADPTTATVDTNGYIVALAAGQTFVNASTKDGSNLTAQCKVIVNKEEGVTDVSSSFRIHIENGSEIVVEGVANDSIVRVLNTSGVEVYVGTDRHISGLSAGLYIVSVEGHIVKVTVK